MKKFLITGGRTYNSYETVYAVLEQIAKQFGKDNICIIQGGAKGADLIAKTWAIGNGVCVIQVDANWTFYDKKAGSLRNKWMLDFCQPDYVVAFKGGFGTKNMIDQSKAKNFKVHEVN